MAQNSVVLHPGAGERFTIRPFAGRLEPGDLTMDLTVEYQILNLVDMNHEFRKEVRQEIREYAGGLLSPNPLPIEKRLAFTAALCWFQLRLFESIGLSALSDGDASTSHQRRVNLVHTRYLKTMRTLASVQRGLTMVGRQVEQKQQRLGRRIVRELLAGAREPDDGRPDAEPRNGEFRPAPNTAK
jgi:hypothetical protein